MDDFDAASTRALLPAGALIDAVSAAMRARRAGRLHAPERLVLPLPGDGRFLAMPAADESLAIAKLVSVHPANAARGLPTIHGRVLVTDALTGQPLMLLDGPTVTARRTAAVTALGLRTLLPPPVRPERAHRPVSPGPALRPAPRAIALVGTGVQAAEHAVFLAEAGLADVLHLVGRDRSKTDALAEHLAALLPAGVRLATHTELGALGSTLDAVITLTTSQQPVLPDELPARLLVVGVGAFRPDMAELPARLLRHRPVVVDALDGARTEAGDLMQADIDWSHVTELVDHLDLSPAAGVVPVFKTVGQAAWDLAAAHVACSRRGNG